MARAGSFGRLPRYAPDLSGAIAALMREAQAQKDQNMVDAWKNGGEVDGKPVTDKRLLDHFRARRDALSKDDPNWDKWDNTVTQYTYAIEESEIMVKWDNGKVSQGAVAAFYRKWANKTPKGTEFYRTLMSNAGKWAASARAAGRAASARAAAEAHNKWVDGKYKSTLEPVSALTGAIMQVLKDMDAMPDNATSLDQIDPNSWGYEVLSDIMEGDFTGNAATQKVMDEVKVKIRASNPEYADFNWRKADIKEVLEGGKAGVKALIKNSTSKSERDGWKKHKDGVTVVSSLLSSGPVWDQIVTRTEQIQEDINDCRGDAVCMKKAVISGRDDLTALQGKLIGDPNRTAAPLWGPLQTGITRLDDIANGRESKDTGPRDYSIFDFAGVTSLKTAEYDNQYQKQGENGFDFTNKYIKEAETAQKNGGWVTYEDTGTKDEQGNPILGTRWHDPKVDAPPQGSIQVPTGQYMDQPVRSDSGVVIGSGKVPVMAYVIPTDVMGTPGYGGTVEGDLNSIPLYKKVTSITPAGNVVTTYITGTGTPQDPFQYHLDEPKFSNTEKRSITDDDGNVQIVTIVSRKGDAPTTSGSMTGNANGAPITVYTPERDFLDDRQPGKNGIHPFGSYGSLLGSLVGADIESAQSKDPRTTMEVAKTGLKTIDDAIAAASAKGDKATADLLGKDRFAVDQTAKLVAGGFTGKALDENLNLLNQLSFDQMKYVRDLESHGITAGKMGALDFVARVNRLQKVDELEGAQKRSGDTGGLPMIYPDTGTPPGMFSQKDRTDYGAVRGQIYNPTVNPWWIKLPGLGGYSPEEQKARPQTTVPSVATSPNWGMTVGMMGTAGQSLFSNIPSTYSYGSGLPQPKGNTYTPPKTDYKPPEKPKDDGTKKGGTTPPPTTYGAPTGGPAAGPNAGNPASGPYDTYGAPATTGRYSGKRMAY